MKPISRPITFIATLLGTWFGSGLIPKAPGTMGTLTGLLLVYGCLSFSWELRLFVWIAILLIGTWSSRVICEATQTTDNQKIVIDEVLGIGITTVTLGKDNALWLWICSFCLFRLFDVLKPFPIRKIDQWSKKQTRNYWKTGFGVMADDLLAGVFAAAIIVMLQVIF